LPVALFALTLIAFARSLGYGFVDFDDTKLITTNPDFRGLSPPHLKWMFGATLMGHWQPLTWVSYGIDYVIAGLDPWQYHFTNLLLHAANAVLLHWLIVRLMRAAMPGRDGPGLLVAAAAGSLLWAIHPLRVESVTWVTERRDVLSGFFLLLASLAYLRAFPPGSTRPVSWPMYLASMLLLACSLMSKAWGMTFFVVITIVDWYPLRRLPESPLHWLRRSARPVILQKLPYMALGLGSAYMASTAQQAGRAVRTLAEWPIGARIAQAAYGLLFYPWKTLWPTDLCALYELRHGLNPLAPEYLLCYALVAGTGIAVLLTFRRRPAIAAAIGAYGVLISPVLGLHQSGDQFVADRYSYLACMPWSFLLAAGVLLAAPLMRAWVRWGAVGGAAASLAAATWVQMHSWSSTVALWRHAWEGDPTRMVPHVNYGLAVEALARAHDAAGRPDQALELDDEAREHYTIATRLKPEDGRGWHALGNILRRRGDRAGAEAAFRHAIDHLPQAYMPLVNLANMIDAERPAEALELYRRAVDEVENPRPGAQMEISGVPFLTYGLALKRAGDLDGARRALERALAFEFSNEQVKREARLQLEALPR
jgi:protein O-mannosyl-transferase